MQCDIGYRRYRLQSELVEKMVRNLVKVAVSKLHPDAFNFHTLHMILEFIFKAYNQFMDKQT